MLVTKDNHMRNAENHRRQRNNGSSSSHGNNKQQQMVASSVGVNPEFLELSFNQSTGVSNFHRESSFSIFLVENTETADGRKYNAIRTKKSHA